MRKILLTVALVLVMAIPAMSAVKPTAMDIVVYQPVVIGSWECPSGYFNYNACQSYECVDWFLGFCIEYDWNPIQLVYVPIYTDEIERVQAGVGETLKIKAHIYSELPRDIAYRLVVTRNGVVVFKTNPKVPLALPGGEFGFDLPDWEFTDPGMYIFTLQAILPNGTVTKASTRVFVPAPPGAEPALEEEPALHESIDESIEE